MYFTRSSTIADSLTKELVNKYFNIFFPDSELQGYEVIPRGTENISIIVNYSSNFYVLRIASISKKLFHEKNAADLLKSEHKFIEYLRTAGMRVPTIYSTHKENNTFSILVDSSNLIVLTLMDFIHGEHPEYSVENIRKIGTLQYLLHEKSVDYNSTYGDLGDYSALSYRMKYPIKIWSQLFPSAIYEEMYSIYQKNLPELLTYYRDTKKYLIHNDLKSDNIIFLNDEQIYFIDFGDARLSVIAEDLGVFIWDMCNTLYNNGIDFSSYVIEYLDSYQRYNSDFKNSDKKMAIYYAIDRYLVINLYYLVYNQRNLEMMKYQTDKADKQLKIIDQLLKLGERFNDKK